MSLTFNTKAEAMSAADALGIEPRKSWTIAQYVAAIEKAQADLVSEAEAVTAAAVQVTEPEPDTDEPETEPTSKRDAYGWNVASRNPAWYSVGQTVGEAMNAEEALAAAGMAGWNVRKEKLKTASGLVIPNKVATVRTDPTTGKTKYLGVVGPNYTVHQNEDTMQFLDTLVDVSGSHYDALGYKGDGHRFFVTMKLPEGIQIGGEDAVDMYLLATNGHNGNVAFQISVVPLRAACTNQLTSLRLGAQQSWKIRHTSGMDGRLQEARESLSLTFTYMDEFSAAMEKLLAAEFSESKFERLAKKLIPDAKTAGRQDAVTERRGTLFDLFTQAETTEFGRGTKYAAYNAITEYADWFTPVRGDADGEKRAHKVMDELSRVQRFKDTGLRLLQAA